MLVQKYKFDYSKLRGKIREKYKNETIFANAIGLSTVSLSHRLNGKIPFKSDEIYLTCNLLGIDMVDIPQYFFVILTKKT